MTSFFFRDSLATKLRLVSNQAVLLPQPLQCWNYRRESPMVVFLGFPLLPVCSPRSMATSSSKHSDWMPTKGHQGALAARREAAEGGRLCDWEARLSVSCGRGGGRGLHE